MTHFLGPLCGPAARACELVEARTGIVVAHALEAAFDQRTRRRGLLGREALLAGHGLVLAPCNAIHTWFMRFPIDVAFVGRDGTVLKTVERLAAWRVAASMGAFATIELPDGTLRRRGIVAGDRLALHMSRAARRAVSQLGSSSGHSSAPS